MKECKVCITVAPCVKGGVMTAPATAVLQPIFHKLSQHSEASSLLVGGWERGGGEKFLLCLDLSPETVPAQVPCPNDTTLLQKEACRNKCFK